MAHLTNPNTTLTQPSVRKACPGDWTSNDGCCGICAVHRNDHEPRKTGTYVIHMADMPRVFGTQTTLWFCHVYRNDLLITTVSGRDESSCIAEARRNVRNARKAGGL